MRILFADSLSEVAVSGLQQSGATCDVMASLTEDTLVDHVAGYDVLVVRSTRVSAAAIEAGTHLGLIVRAGAGTNTIDCERAAELGVLVCNVPGRNAIAVAELTMGLIFAIDRHIASATSDLRAGTWNKKQYSRSRGLYGATLGIIGMGAIGVEVAERANCFGMQVVTLDRPRRDRDMRRRLRAIDVQHAPDLAELLAVSDIVSLHVPSTPETNKMVNASFLSMMKPDAVLINTSRGDVVDEAALLAALNSTDMRAGLDVFADEPGASASEFRSALAAHPKVTATHHIGASTRQAQEAVAEGAVEVIDAYRTGSVMHCVNLERIPRHTATLRVRHRDRVGVLAAVLQQLRSHNLNVATMQNRIFAGAVAALATIDVVGEIHDGLLEDLRALPNVIQVSVL